MPRPICSRRWSARWSPVNRGWTEPEEGVTIYLANNGIHSDIVMPAKAEGLDWAPFVPKS